MYDCTGLCASCKNCIQKRSKFAVSVKSKAYYACMSLT